LARVAEALLPDSFQGVGHDVTNPVQTAPDRSRPSGEEIADNVESFLIRGRSKRAWRVRGLMVLVEYSPLLRAQPPLSRMTVAQRRRLITDRYVDGKHLWGICAKVRFLVLMGAYGDARLHAPTSYVPVSRRPRFIRTLNGTQAAS
jgi:hypothetical protein